MSLRVRVGLSLVLLTFCASGSASALPLVVGTFNYSVEACDKGLDEFCEDAEYFSITNDIDGADPLYGAMTWFAALDLGGFAVPFIDATGDGVVGAAESAITGTRLPGTYFTFADIATLTFSEGNFADYGALSISNSLDAGTSSAAILFEPQAQPVPEPASIVLLLTSLGVTALRRRSR